MDSSCLRTPPLSPKDKYIAYSYGIPLEIDYQTNRILLKLALFTISFLYSIENIWVTALMISYNTHYFFYCTVWVLPYMIAMAVRPYLMRYVNLVKITMRRESAVVGGLMLLGGIGCIIVGLSTQINRRHYILRILVCIVGWSMMDASMELCVFFIDRMRQFLDENFSGDSNQVSQQNVRVGGSLMGVFVTFVLFGMTGSSGLKRFIVNCRYVYYLGGLVSCGSSLLFLAKYSYPYQPLYVSLDSFKLVRNVQYYVPGYLQLMSASMKVKLRLVVHFLMYMINDIVMIYTTMWVVYSVQNDNAPIGVSYCMGVSDGSLGIASYIILTQAIVIKYQLAFLFEGILVISMILGVVAFWKFSIIWIFTLVLLLGACINIYKNQIVPIWQESFPLFTACRELGERASKLMVLLVMPAWILIVMNRDDVEDSMFFGVMGLGVCVYISVNATEIHNKMARNSFKSD